MVELQKIFDVKYGLNLELNNLVEDSNGVNFVSRTAKNNGVSAKVQLLPMLDPIDAGVITVSGGGSVLEAFLQVKPFYSGRDLYYLKPKFELTDCQKLFYCACIRANKYKYCYGRQANRTLGMLPMPAIEEIPLWVSEISITNFKDVAHPFSAIPFELNTLNWKSFIYDELFDVIRGESLYLQDLLPGVYPYVSASSQNNGISAMVSVFNQLGNAITLSYDGSIGEAFYQPQSFLASEKIVTIRLKKKFNQELNPYIALFISALLRQEKFKYNYGLKWSVNSRLLKSTIKLPVDKDSDPDWVFIENYIKSLPYSRSL